MGYPSVFEKATVDTALQRLEKLSPETKPQWGKMNSAQMLAHLNVAYDVTYGLVTPKVGGFMKLMLKLFVKPMVVGDKPYKRNSRTAPYFVVADSRDFAEEKSKLVDYINHTLDEGPETFEGKESASFGKMSAQQWSNQFYKHMDHHFSQFGI